MNECNSPLPLVEVLRPADAAGVADAVRRACREGTPLYPIGGGTNLGYGARPAEPGLGLSLSGLKRFVDYPARDLTITVEAGVTIAALAKRLAGEGQRLPIDVAYPDRATVGGVVAAGCTGPRHYRWGTIRDYVIGVSRGGRLREGVFRRRAGGQERRRLRPLPLAHRFVRQPRGDYPSDAHGQAAPGDVGPVGLRRGRLSMPPKSSWPAWSTRRVLPSAIELMAGPAWKDDSLLGPLPESSSVRLAVGLEGTTAEVEWMIHRLQDEWAPGGRGRNNDAPRAAGRSLVGAVDGVSCCGWKRRRRSRDGGPDQHVARGRCRGGAERAGDRPAGVAVGPCRRRRDLCPAAMEVDRSGCRARRAVAAVAGPKRRLAGGPATA